MAPEIAHGAGRTDQSKSHAHRHPTGHTDVLKSKRMPSPSPGIYMVAHGRSLRILHVDPTRRRTVACRTHRDLKMLLRPGFVDRNPGTLAQWPFEDWPRHLTSTRLTVGQAGANTKAWEVASGTIPGGGSRSCHHSTTHAHPLPPIGTWWVAAVPPAAILPCAIHAHCACVRLTSLGRPSTTLVRGRPSCACACDHVREHVRLRSHQRQHTAVNSPWWTCENKADQHDSLGRSA
jgi:hypothetical protein